MNEPLAIDSASWHRTVGILVDSLDKPNFWKVLVRYLGDAVPFDSWVVLCFKHNQRPEVLAESPTPDGSDDELFKEYLDGYYLLDPFYLACMEDPRAGLLRLDDVAPDNFEHEEYFQRYFRLNVVKDEIQFNLPLAPGCVLIFSLGAAHRYTVAEINLLAAIAPWVLALMRQRAQTSEFAAAWRHTGDEPTAASAGVSVDLLKTGLTEREVEILHLLLSGFSSKSIALKLSISPETVKAHRRHIYLKLGVKSHPELFAILLKSRTKEAEAAAHSHL